MLSRALPYSPPLPSLTQAQTKTPKKTTSTKSFVFKRNYTFSIVDRGSDAASWWGATGKTFTTGSYTFSNQDPKDFSSVVCGINIFGQDDYYKNPKQGSTLPFNGLCRTNKREFSEWIGSGLLGRD